MDKKTWMYMSRSSTEFFNGLTDFIKFVVEKTAVNGVIYCPCKKCYNRFSFDPETIEAHLAWDGFQENYYC